MSIPALRRIASRPGSVAGSPAVGFRRALRGAYSLPRVSPDGKRLAVEVADRTETYIAIYDLDGRTALRRLTFGGSNRYPVRSRDSARVTFQSDRECDLAIFWQRADGAAPAERLTRPEKDQVKRSSAPGRTRSLLQSAREHQ